MSLDPAHPPVKIGRLQDQCAWCEKWIRVHDRTWETIKSDEALPGAANFCSPLKGDLRDEDWLDETGARNKGKVRSGCERLGQASPDVVVRRLRKRQADLLE